jgi:acetyltransferase-like isoleucine patch superfamily enzyme
MRNPFVPLAATLRRQWSRVVEALGGQEAKIRLLRKAGVRIGERCRVYTNNFGTEPYLVRIGDHCTITSGVRFITHDGSCWVLRDELANLQDFGAIVVEDNCFIGVNAVILPGVRIGPNSIVGAGSIVTKDVPPGVVVGGVPARVLMPIAQYRDKKMKLDAARDVPTDPVEKRTYLEKRFGAFLDRSQDR